MFLDLRLEVPSSILAKLRVSDSCKHFSSRKPTGFQIVLPGMETRVEVITHCDLHAFYSLSEFL